MDNTTFGDDTPNIPRWAGPPYTIVQVQAVLFASLATSLFSAFLAMLGKQWLNRYASVDVRGSAIERSQNRQRKLDGVVSWYFDPVMESLPLMLQAALLLLGLALSRYLWEINTTVASVVIAFTCSGVLFFFLIVIAGASSVSCPYQTPGAQILRRVTVTLLHRVTGTLPQILRALYLTSTIGYSIRHILYYITNILHRIPHIPRRIQDIICRIPGILRSIPDILHYIPDTIRLISWKIYWVFSPPIKSSICYGTLRNARYGLGHPSPVNISTALFLIFLLPIWLTMDACMAIIWLLDSVSHQSKREPEQQMALLDLHCISWTLQTSLDGPVRLSTLDYLASTTLANFDPTLVAGCFDILFGCVKHVGGRAVITQGMEQLAEASSICCLRTLSRLIATDPTSKILEDTCRRYAMTFPRHLYNLPFYRTLYILHTLFHGYSHGWIGSGGWGVRWEGYEPPSAEHVIVAHTLVDIAWFTQQEQGYGGVIPCWILRFALHSLSQSPLPPTSIVIDSLSIVAIDLGCNPFDTPLGERCAHV